jgi:molybdate transport system substrate-binding protein
LTDRLKQLIGKTLFAATLAVSLIVPPHAKAEDLLVSTAISLKGALFDISRKFESIHPGVHVVLNAASSGELAAQIENGAQVDVFLSANNKEMQSLKQHGLLSSAPAAIAYNRLVITTPSEAPPIKSMSDLKKLSRIAIGIASTVPAGRYAEQALKAANLLTDLQRRHALIYGQNARALITYVELGNVDAGLVYLTDYKASKLVGKAFMVSKNMTDPIAYEIASISRSKHAELASQFIQFALSEPSKANLLKYHFELSWN